MIHKSLNKKYKVFFIDAGEIRFGPIYYKLELNDAELPNRIFGYDHRFSYDSKYLALQEWLTTDYQKGPITRVLLIDLPGEKFSEFEKVAKGWVKPIEINDKEVVFEKTFFSMGAEKKGTYEVSMDSINNWQPLPFSIPPLIGKEED
ncbi:MAG: hypothetical protein HRU19_32645 [Pseudobacteriovorax sp.]|nr:hypothetical protein [Pseudobacteriovorax sp.]